MIEDNENLEDLAPPKEPTINLISGQWLDASHTVAKCEIEHEVLGVIPYGARRDDPSCARVVALIDAEPEKVAAFVPPSELELLQAAQSSKLEEIETGYQIAIAQNISFNGHDFQADAASVGLMSQVLAVGMVPEGFYWLSADNSPVPMSRLDLQALAGEILARGQVAFATKQRLKTLVKEAVTVADVEAVAVAF